MLRSACVALHSLRRAPPKFEFKYAAAPDISEALLKGGNGRRSGRESGWGVGILSAMSGVSVATAYASSKADHVSKQSEAVTLFQYDVCPWCNKVKAVLDYNNIPYRAVEVNPLLKTELKFSEGYKKVPIMLTAEGEQINDSNEIIQHLLKDLTPAKEGWLWSGKVPKVTDEEQRWRDWADDKLMKLVTVNIYRNWAEAYQAMDYVKYVQSFSLLQQTAAYYFGGAVMYFVGTKLVPKYGLEGKDLRQELRLAVDSYIGALGDRKFMGGSTPGLADLHVFGILRAVSSTETFQFVLSETEAFPWWQRMVEAVGESSRIEEVQEIA